MPLIWYSIGSSMVMMFFSLELTRFRAAYRVVDLPLPVGPVQHALHGADTRITQADISQGEHTFLLVQQTQHGALAVKGWYDRHTDVHVASGHQHPDTAILGQAFFCYIQSGHDFYAGNQCFLYDFGWCQFFVEDAVDAETDHQVAFVGFDMNVADPLL